MRNFIVAGLAVATLAIGSLTPAEAIQGCGPYGRRNVYGVCRPIGPAYGYGWGRPYYGWRRPYGFYGPRPYGWRRPYGYGYRRW